MAENNFTGVIESLMKGMNAVIGTKTVVGDATQMAAAADLVQRCPPVQCL